MSILKYLLLVGLLLGAASTWAQEEQFLRVEITELSDEQIETGWFSELRRFLGAKVIRPKEGTKFIVQSSAYASSPRQTDSTPCITAAGTRVRPGVVATNFLPMGTLLKINGNLHIVEDRMNSRYAGKYLDIWFPSTSSALEFGRRKMEIEVVGYGKPGQELSTKPDAKAPSALKRVHVRFSAFAQGISSSLFTRVSPNVNRYDVNCAAAK